MCLYIQTEAQYHQTPSPFEKFFIFLLWYSLFFAVDVFQHEFQQIFSFDLCYAFVRSSSSFFEFSCITSISCLHIHTLAYKYLCLHSRMRWMKYRVFIHLYHLKAKYRRKRERSQQHRQQQINSLEHIRH